MGVDADVGADADTDTDAGDADADADRGARLVLRDRRECLEDALVPPVLSDRRGMVAEDVREGRRFLDAEEADADADADADAEELLSLRRPNT